VRPALLRLGEALGPGRLLVAGALSAVVSRTAVAPLERIKMELQLRSAALAGAAGQGLRGGAGALRTALHVLQHEGLPGFWRGHGVNVLRTAPHKAVNFACFDIYSQALMGAVAALAVSRAGDRQQQEKRQEQQKRRQGEGGGVGAGSSTENDAATAAATALARFGAGALAGVTATLTCYPLDVLRTRLCAPGGAGAVEQYRRAYGAYGGPVGVLFGIARHEGMGALYAGCLPAVVGMIPAGAVFYGVFAALKDAHLAREQDAYERARLRCCAEAKEAAAAAAAAAAEAAEGGRRKRGRRNRQTSSLSSPPPPLTLPPSPSGELPVAATLLYGAAAGAASELIVYPLEVVRRRMQLQQAAAAAAAGAAAVAGAGAAAAAGPPLRAVAGAAAGAGGAAAVARVVAACLEIARQRGLRGLYSGLAPNLLQVLPSSALSYYTFETAKVALGAGAGGGGVDATTTVRAAATTSSPAVVGDAGQQPKTKEKKRRAPREDDDGGW
jgi:solute carrier family 25 phosphate transporter 23/24/25/41